MKKKFLAAALAVILAAAALPSAVLAQDKEELTEVTLNEVAHSIFYAPQYVAIEEGYFEEEGLKIDLVNGFGADKVMTAVISGEADIGFMGAEASVYAYRTADSVDLVVCGSPCFGYCKGFHIFIAELPLKGFICSIHSKTSGLINGQDRNPI